MLIIDRLVVVVLPFEIILKGSHSLKLKSFDETLDAVGLVIIDNLGDRAYFLEQSLVEAAAKLLGTGEIDVLELLTDFGLFDVPAHWEEIEETCLSGFQGEDRHAADQIEPAFD
jgi:hypothetical protein